LEGTFGRQFINFLWLNYWWQKLVLIGRHIWPHVHLKARISLIKFLENHVSY
jgi:hypothetical protein